MTTYKQVIQLFQDICDNHYAIKFFNYGALSDIEVNQDDFPTQQYPMVYLNPVSINLVPGYAIYTLNLLVFDLARIDREDTMEVHDTTLQIMMDILSVFKMQSATEYNMNIQNQPTLMWFKEAQKNSVAGWSASIVVSTEFPYDISNAAFSTTPSF